MTDPTPRRRSARQIADDQLAEAEAKLAEHAALLQRRQDQLANDESRHRHLQRMRDYYAAHPLLQPTADEETEPAEILRTYVTQLISPIRSTYAIGEAVHIQIDGQDHTGVVTAWDSVGGWLHLAIDDGSVWRVRVVVPGTGEEAQP